MAKDTLFRAGLFGYNKADVHAFLSRQNDRIEELKNRLAEMESSFDRYRGFYEGLLSIHAENLRLLQEVRLRADESAAKAQTLFSVFNSLADAYRDLLTLATAQSEQLKLAQIYEQKALHYDELALRMKEMVLPASMQTPADRHVPLTDLPAVPVRAALDAFIAEATAANTALCEDCGALKLAAARLRTPEAAKVSDDAAAV